MCSECGTHHPRWLGRCSGCGAWSSLLEEPIGTPAGGTPRERVLAEIAGPRGVARPLCEIEVSATPRFPTGMPELDRVLGDGLVPGSVLLLGGEPGVGKSTIALQLAACLQSKGTPVLYVSGEESAEQIRLRAERLGNVPGDLWVLAETHVEAIAASWGKRRPALVVVDSVQTLHTERVESAPGSVAQVRESAALLAATAKALGTALLLIGHVTKEGMLAGPRVLEHLVDVVLTFEGDREHVFRILRATKNRFGTTREVGVFTMGERGLLGVANPSELFLAERRAAASGSCIVPLLEGSRPMLIELQALVAPAGYGTARRTCIGVDDGRVALMLAVLDRSTDIDLASRDVYVNVTGGVRVAEPAVDLGLSLALASSRLDLCLPADVAACGEVGLGGEIRRVGRMDLRLREAARLGFERILVPDGACAAADVPPEVRVVGVSDVAQALRWLRGEHPSAPPRTNLNL